MKSNNIAFDLDGTLVDLVGQIKITVKEMFNVKLIVGNTFRLNTEPPISSDEMWEAIWTAYTRHDQLVVYPDVSDMLQKLYDITGEAPLIITARPDNKTSFHLAWLAVFNFCPVPFKLICTGGRDKIEFLDNVDFYVEDRRRNAIDLAKAGKYIYLIDKPYNQIVEPIKNIERISCIGDLLPVIDKHVRYDRAA